MPPSALLQALRQVTLITGHYGVGKTNFALNLALDLAKSGREVRVVDLDVVNPYFRSSEYSAILNDAGIQLVAPVMANSSLDTPSLGAAVDGSFAWAREDGNRILLIDVGGDDAGATALGRYSDKIKAGDYAMLYVVNAYRNLTQDPSEAVEILEEIKAASKLEATGIVNNSHMHRETTSDIVSIAKDYGHDVAWISNVPLVAQTASNLAVDGNDAEFMRARNTEETYPVKILVTTPWE